MHPLNSGGVKEDGLRHPAVSCPTYLLPNFYLEGGVITYKPGLYSRSFEKDKSVTNIVFQESYTTFTAAMLYYNCCEFYHFFMLKNSVLNM